MSLYLYQNDQQTGPFTEDKIRQMLLTGAITPGTLAWKDGMASWTPVSSILTVTSPSPGAPPPPPAKTSGSWLGMSSLIIGIVSALGWVVFLGIVGVAHKNGEVTQTFNIIVGFIFIGGVAVNFLAAVLGFVGIFKSKSNTLSIIGACLNGFVLLALVGLIILGMAAKSQGVN